MMEPERDLLGEILAAGDEVLERRQVGRRRARSFEQPDRQQSPVAALA